MPETGDPNMELLEGYLAAIRQAEPGLRFSSATLNEGGQNSVIVVLDGAFIARFPRYEDVRAQLIAEAELLRRLRGSLPLPIPAPELEHLSGPPIGQAFMAYRRLPGEPLWRETFAAIKDEATLERLAAQLAGFLRALHAIPVDSLSPLDLQPLDFRDDWRWTYERIRRRLFPRMRSDARVQVAHLFSGYMDADWGWQQRRCLKHGDFGPSNILWDPASGGAAGIIDFGSAGLGDPAYDFAGLLSGYGEAFLARCAPHYPGLDELLPRVRFYRSTFALLEALYGVEHGDERALRAGLANYI